MKVLICLGLAALAAGASTSSLTFSHVNGAKKNIVFNGDKLIVPDTCSSDTCGSISRSINRIEGRLDALESWKADFVKQQAGGARA